MPAFRDMLSSFFHCIFHVLRVLLSALNDEDFMVNTMADAKRYFYKL